MLFRLFFGLTLVVAIADSDGLLCSSPMAQSNIILLNIAETLPINTVLTRLNITGNDSQIRLEMSMSDYVEFISATRELISRQTFNVSGDTTMRIYVNLICHIRSSSLPPTTLQVIIQVTDMNNNPPYFVNLPYSVNISERTAVNTIIFQGAQAIDADPCDQGYLSYSVQDNGNPFSSYFAFPVWSVGNLVLMKYIDYETTQMISLMIAVTDNGNNITIMGQLQPQHTATTTMIIHIIPGDDYNPKFDQWTYKGVLTDIKAQGRTVSIFPPIKASIKYAKPDEEIVYGILQDPNNADGSNFVINNRTGVIMTSALGNFDANQYVFQLQATKVNETHRYGTAMVRLNVVRSTQPLTFTQRIYSAAVDDSASNGTLVATVAVIDGGQRPTYSFVGDIVDFSVNSRTGEIRTAKKLFQKTNLLYNLSVTATDSNYTDTCLVMVTITRLNRYNPRFAQRIYTFNVSATSTSVGRVEALDEDPDTALTYRLIDNSGLFAVDRSGLLTYSSSSILSNSSSSHSFLVVAEDDGMPPRQDSSLVVVSWATSWVPDVPQPNPLCTSPGENRTYYVVVIVLGVLAGLLLLLAILLAVCLYRKSISKATPGPRITIEVERSPTEKTRHPSSHESCRSAGGGFEVTKEYGPYLPYVRGKSTDDVSHPSSSVLNSTDKLQKLRIYHSVPMDRNAAPDPRSSSQQSRKPPAYPPYSSTSISTTSTTPSSRVERYNFEEVPGSAHPSGSVRPPRSVSPPRRASQTPAPYNSVPGPRRAGKRPQTTVAAFRDSNSGDTSSTETLVTPVNARGKPSTLSFVDNPAGYLSSQEGMDVSMSALTRTDGESGIIVYY